MTIRMRAVLADARRRGWCKALAGAAGGDGGMSIVEVMVALGIFIVALLALITTAVVGFADLGLARQRQAANGIANRLMEEVRGLPVPSDIAKGLSSTDSHFLSDPNITGPCTDGLYHFRGCGGEVLVTTPNLSPTPPLVPHRATVEPDTNIPGRQRTVYTRSVYVTRADPSTVSTASGAFRIVVLVTWGNPMRRGASSTVESQSLLYHPRSCSGSPTHPFSAPCSPYFYGAGAITQGRFDLSGTIDSQSFTASSAMGSGRTQLQIEQIGQVQGAVNLSGQSLSGPSTDSLGGSVARSQATDDLGAAGVGPYESNQTVAGSGGSIGFTTASGRRLRLASTSASAAGGDGRSTSAIAASNMDPTTTPPTPANPCPTDAFLPTDPAPQSDKLPCGHARFHESHRQSASLEFETSILGVNLGVANLFTSEVPSAASWILGDRQMASGQDRLMATGRRSVGATTMFGLPAGVNAPLAWLGYYLRVSPYTAAAQAASGTGTNAPSASVTADGSGQATLTFWNGTTYSTVNIGATAVTVNPCTAATTVGCIAPLTVSDPLGNIRITITPGTMSSGGIAISERPAGAGSNATRTEAGVTVNSPLRGTLNYKVEIGGVLDPTTIADVTVAVDFGAFELRSGYRASPV